MGKMLDQGQVLRLKKEFIQAFIGKVEGELKKGGLRYNEPQIWGDTHEGKPTTTISIENNSGSKLCLLDHFTSDRLKLTVVSCFHKEGVFDWDSNTYFKPFSQITFTMSI